MKKEISFLTHVAALCFLLLIATLSPVMAFHHDDPADTAYYYNEHGRLLWRDGQAGSTINYIIKTKKQTSDLFQELASGDSTVAVSPYYAPATVLSISRRTARKVQRLIRKGHVDDPLVTSNIIPLLDKQILRRMYDNIQSLCKTTNDDGFREKGGVLLPDGTLTCIIGDISDPRTLAGAALFLKQQGLVYYHSHPDGSIEKRSTASYASMEQPNFNRVYFSGTQQTSWISYIQGPSKQDQEAVGQGTGYVFGMSAGSAMIYIYDREGVKATLPMWFVKKVKKPAGRQLKKVETYTAGLLPAAPLSRSF
jgi:hypothetical protein